MIRSKARSANLHQHQLEAPSPEGKPLEVPWIQQGKHAFLESYHVIGNDSLSTDKPLNPLYYSSHGLGVALKKIAQHPGIEAITVGLGSSAIVDGGLGLLAALGAQFYNAAQTPIKPHLTQLQHIASLTPPTVALPTLHLISDVENPILGPRGGLRVYGPQKGLKGAELNTLEHDFTQHWLPLLARVKNNGAMNSLGLSGAGNLAAFTQQKHGGAAGGVGLALGAFFAVQWHQGANWCVNYLALDKGLEHADALITGEGCFDTSSLEGKITGRLIALGNNLCKPVLGVFGQREPSCKMPLAFERVPYQGASHAAVSDRTETEAWLREVCLHLLDTLEQLLDHGDVSKDIKQNNNQ